MTDLDKKIHPFLPRSFREKRSLLLIAQAEAALRFEIMDEQIDEREYDEQQRMRVHRTINRKVIRGEAYERYSSLVAGLREDTTAAVDLESTVRAQLDEDLRSVASGETIHDDLAGALRRYADLLSPEKWPAILCLAHDPAAADKIRSRVVDLGLPHIAAGLLEQFGIMKFACPPEVSFVREIANFPEMCFIADAGTPVTAPEPMATTTMMAESRQILGVTPDMTEHFGHDVSLAVLDTGVDRSHPAFAGLKEGDYRNFTSVDDTDFEGHGTHVASIAAGNDPTLAGKYAGIAPGCRLIVGKVISGRRTGDLEAVLNGMAWAVFEKRADILSLSLGDPETPPNGLSIWTRACDEAFRQGTVVCLAAGNPQPSHPESITVPGDSVTAITVGAIDKHRRLAPFSAQGSPNPKSPLFGKPNCVGPGVDVVAARSAAAAFDSNQIVDSLHARLSGTSMAAPAIAGCLALLKSKARSLGWEITPAELGEVFYAACRPFQNASGANYRSDIEVGHGLVDMGEAFREVKRRALARPSTARTATEQAEQQKPPVPDAPPDVDMQTPAKGSGKYEPDVCYLCGKRYLSKVNTFSPARKCAECGAPICVACWQIGARECEKHRKSPALTAVHPLDPLYNRPAGKEMTRSFASSNPRPSLSPEQVRKGISAMPSAETPSHAPAAVPASRWGDTFINRFGLKVRNAGGVKNPVSDEEYRVDPKARIQSFKRSFGEVAQLPLTAGLLKKVRFAICAIRLEEPAVAASASSQWPPTHLLRELSGPAGLDFQDETFYCVGIFSPLPWPEEWKTHAEMRDNAVFYLIEKGDGTCWRVFGPEGPLIDLFDPESEAEKKARARKALANHTKLVLPGDQIAMDSFLDEHHLNRKGVEAAIRASQGRFRILDHKGKSFIQRSIQ